MVAVLWSNGQRDEAETWDALLEKVRLSQPRKYGPVQFRRELQRRARLWAGFHIDETLPARKLFQELEYAKVVVIVERDEKEES